jgi:hypothetical protein
MEPQIHQIPPLELVQQWLGEQYGRATVPGQVTIYITTQAAQWGADQQLKLDAEQIAQSYQAGADMELDACCEVLARELICDGKHVATDLRMIRRPKPPSLKEQAIKDLDDLEANLKDFGMGFVPITNLRKALEALPND